MQPIVMIEGFGPSPVGTIYAIGRNYADHAKELGNPVPTEQPVVFLKAASSVRHLASGSIAYPQETFHHEAEVVLHIGQFVPVGSKNVGWEIIDGIGLGIDLTRREVQSGLKAKGLPWTIAKSFAGASLISSFVQISDVEFQQPLKFKFFVNDALKQAGDTSDMIFDVPTILNYLASCHPLLPGDIVFTGTPVGVGPLRVGDRFMLELEHPHRRWEGVL